MRNIKDSMNLVYGGRIISTRTKFGSKTTQGQVAYCYKGIHKYEVIYSKLNDRDAEERLETHEYGHIYLGHLDGLEYLRDRLTRLINDNFDDLTALVNTNCGIDFGDKLLIQVREDPMISHMIHNIAMDCEVNSKILDYDDVHMIEKSVFDTYGGLQKVDVMTKFCHPLKRWGFPEGLTYPEYLELIVQNLDKFVKYIMLMTYGVQSPQMQQGQSGQSQQSQSGQGQGQGNSQSQNQGQGQGYSKSSTNRWSGSGQHGDQSTESQSSNQSSDQGRQDHGNAQDPQQGSDQSNGSQESQGSSNQQSSGQQSSQGSDQDGSSEGSQQGQSPTDGSSQSQTSSHDSSDSSGSSGGNSGGSFQPYDGQGRSSEGQSSDQDDSESADPEEGPEQLSDRDAELLNDQDYVNRRYEEIKNQLKSPEDISNAVSTMSGDEGGVSDGTDGELRGRKSDHGSESREKVHVGEVYSPGGAGKGSGRSTQTRSFIKDLDPIDMGLEEVLKNYRKKVIKRTFSRNLTYKYNRKIITDVISPSYTMRITSDTDPTILFIIDVSGSMDTSLVDRCIDIIRRKIRSINSNLKYHILTWDTDFCELYKDLNTKKNIPRISCGGGTSLARSFIYAKENFDNSTILVVISDFEDNLHDWEVAMSKMKDYIIHGFNYGYPQDQKNFKVMKVKNFTNKSRSW